MPLNNSSEGIQSAIMAALPSKKALKDELVTILRTELENLERAHQATKEAATHEEAKPENDKDTRALEQSYLARGQALRVEDLRTGLSDVSAMSLRDFADQPIALGALVQVEEDDRTLYLFITAYGGGNTLASGQVQVVTTKSPLGRALLGKREGDESEVKLTGKTRELSIVRVY